jgi:predicted DNA-binding transcriptional regulator YafY
MLDLMTDTPGRLLKLLSLLQTPREWPGSELSRRLEVSARTVRRDVDRLRELGYPVEATMGAEGGYRLVAGTAMPPLLLDDEEAVAIAVGLRIASGHAVEGIDEASVRALTKLERVLPTRLRRRVSALGTATVPMLSGSSQRVDPADLTVLATTIANTERLRFGYADAKRHVEPYRLVTAGRRWYLMAFDLDRDDWRTFRVDRMRDLWPTGARCTPRTPPTADAAEFITRKLHSLRPTYRAVATLRMPAEEVTNKLGDTIGEVVAVDAESCEVRSNTDTLEWLAFRLTMLGCEFSVRSPPELVAYLRDMGARATRAADGPVAF